MKTSDIDEALMSTSVVAEFTVDDLVLLESAAPAILAQLATAGRSTAGRYRAFAALGYAKPEPMRDVDGYVLAAARGAIDRASHSENSSSGRHPYDLSLSMAGRMTDGKFVRVSLGLSQTDFAREIGVAQGTVSRWERGRRAAPSDEAFLWRVIHALVTHAYYQGRRDLIDLLLGDRAEEVLRNLELVQSTVMPA